MASCEKDQEENNRQFSLDEVLKCWDASDNENTDDAMSPDKSEGVSMFCKSCLNPYSGEPKSGTIVLKCERCGQTDVVLEEKAVDLDPEEWSGNLMMNRFLQVLKEQEDLQLNIVDPFFADDDFQNLTLAMQEYTFNMKAMAEKMYDIAREARAELESEVNEDQRISESQDRDTQDTTSDENKVEQENEDVMSLTTRHKLKKLGATVIKLMQSILNKYNLPADIMEKVEDRIRHPSGTSTTEDENQGSESDADVELDSFRDSDEDKTGEIEISNSSGNACSENSNNEENLDENSAKNGMTEIEKEFHGKVQEDSVDELKPNNPERSQGKANDDKPLASSGVGNDMAQGFKDDTREEVDIGEWDDENSPGVALVKEKIKHEIFDVLKEKFALKFESDKTDNENSSTTNAQTQENGEENQNDSGNGSDTGNSATEDTIDNDTINSQTIETDETDKLSSHLLNEVELVEPTEEEEELQVNFYSISSAFINELQSRKRKALIERKDKALAIVHQKIVALKEEVERVENRVHDELTSAYRKKLRKVENQRKQLDKRHEAIQDIEELLNHYARTGQHDKLAELMEQLDIQYEN